MAHSRKTWRQIGAVGTCLVALGTTSACQVTPNAPDRPQFATAAHPAILSGQVQLPGAFATQASIGELRERAAVMLCDLSGAVLVAGTTDGDGRFTLFQPTTPFSPGADQVYVLDVFKRHTNGSLLSMRTYVQHTAGAWRSLTGTSIVINLTTTAVTQLVEADPAVTPADMMGRVTGAPAFASIAPASPLSGADVAGRQAVLLERLTDDRDPTVEPVAVREGDMEVTDAASLAALAGVRRVTGNLILRPTGVPSLTLPDLEEVGGTLVIGGDVVIANLARLRTIGHSLEAGYGRYGITVPCPQLERIECPRLETIGDGLRLWAPALTDLIGFGRVRAFKQLVMYSMPSLHQLPEMPLLTHLDYVGLTDSGLRDLATLRHATQLGDVRLHFLSELPNLQDLGRLRRMGSLEVATDCVYISAWQAEIAEYLDVDLFEGCL